MTDKKPSPWMKKLEKEGLLDDVPLWGVEDPASESQVIIQAANEVGPEDPTRPVDTHAEAKREDQTPVLDQTIRSRGYPNAALRNAMKQSDSTADLPKLAEPKATEPRPQVAQNDVELHWFSGSRPKPAGTYSHTERRHVSVHGKKISVDPQANSNAPAVASGAILDEPPPRNEPAGRTSQAPARFLPTDDFLFGGGSPDDDTGIKRQRDTMRECYDLGDFTGALEHAEAVLSLDPEDRESTAIRRDCVSTLEKMYETRLGDLSAIAQRDVGMDELIWRKLNPTATFIVSLVDGSLSIENILDICGLPRFDGLRLLVRLKEDGIIH